MIGSLGIKEYLNYHYCPKKKVGRIRVK